MAVSRARRVVVFRAGALGDLLLSVPALAALRAQLGATVHLAGSMPQAQLVQAMGLVDEASSIDDLALTPLFLDSPSPAQLDAVPAWATESGLALVWLRRPDTVARNVERLGGTRVLAASPLPPPEQPRHVADWLLETLQPLGVRPVPDWDARPWLRAPPGAAASAGRWIAERLGARPFVVVHPGSGSARKNWPAEHWAQVIAGLCAATSAPGTDGDAGAAPALPSSGPGAAARRPLGADEADSPAVVITAGPADDEPVAGLTGALADSYGLRPVVAQNLSLEQLAGLLTLASLYLGNDSGMSHLAAGLGTPTIAVFGPTDPVLWRPRGPAIRTLGGRGAWPAPDDVLDAARAWLHSP
jgi:heptosyltransferase-3